MLSMKLLKTFLIVIGCILLFIVAAVPFFIRKTDRTPYQQTAFYQQMNLRLDSLASHPLDIDSVSPLLAGWSKVNITPTHPMPTAGYGNRKGKPYESIHDSIYARAIFLQQGQTRVAIVACDLLIIPPELTILLRNQIQLAGIDYAHLYLGATHAHNSIGGWGKRYIGELFAGKYDSAMVQKLATAIISSVKQAAATLAPIELQSSVIESAEWVKNRTMGNKGSTDPFLRVLYFMQKNNPSSKAILTSFAAHATTLGGDKMQLSRDYPGPLVDSLEKKDGYNQAFFLAGAVGSMGPETKGANDWEELTNLATGLETAIQQNKQKQTITPALSMVTLTLPMREPQWRFATDWCFRHWVWTKLYGDYVTEVKVLRIGNLIMVGMPCDFSGELVKPLTDFAASKGKQLMITSFNGGYAGYITKDAYYDIPGYETRVMNWFGPGNAAYFSEIIHRIIAMP
jgi:hypothetical protein